MKKIFPLLLMSNFVMAQVGINTPNPQGAFHIDGSKDNPTTGIPNVAQESNDFTVLSSGYVGIGTILPKQQLHITEPNIVSAITNSYISGIAITGTGSAGSFTGPGFYLENINAPAGSRLLKLNYSMNNTEPVLNFQRVSDDAGASGGLAMILTRSGKLGINNIYTPANNLTVNGNASVGINYVGIAAPPNGTIIEGSVGIGTSAPASSLDITAKDPTGTATNVEGLLVPRIDRERAQSMTNVPNSTLVYINDISTGTAADTTIDVNAVGYYYFDGTKWTAILSSANNNNWQLTGNAGTNPAINFIGTSDNQNVIFKRNNTQAGFLGPFNTAFGVTSLSPTSGAIAATAFGVDALRDTTAGISGSAFGYQALAANTTGANNSAFGSAALLANTTGISNTAVGVNALSSTVIGAFNTAIGQGSLQNTTGNTNTAVGFGSLAVFASGDRNIGIGSSAGNDGSSGVLTSGNRNIIIGSNAGLPNGDNQLNIGSVLFGTGINGTLAARTGNIGIKTPNPQGVFHVDGAADNPVTGAPSVPQQVNDVIVSSTGNVGIATTTPATNLQIGSGTGGLATPTIRLTSSLNAFEGGGVLQFMENNQQYGLIVRHHAGNNGTTEREGLYFNGLAANVENTIPIMMMDQVNSRIGIGTALPASKLHIEGTETRFSNGTSSWGIDPSLGGTTGSSNSLEIVDRVNNVRRMIFNDNGDISMGGGIVNNGTGGVISIRTAAVSIGWLNTTPPATAYRLNVNGDINAVGAVRASGVVLTSDMRLKKDITPTSHGLKTIMALRPVEYEKKDGIENSEYNRHEIGFVAQEIAKVIPSIVTTGTDADKTLGVSYTELIPILTKAIQEQQIQINSLKKEIEELKKK